MKLMKLVSRTILRTALALFQIVIAGPGSAAGAADPSGTWLTQDGRARVRIERCGARLEQVCGFIVWMKEPVDANGQPLKDQNNPDPAKRPRPLLGHQLILGLKPTAEGRFNGQIYNAENGKSYEIALSARRQGPLRHRLHAVDSVRHPRPGPRPRMPCPASWSV